MSRQQAERRGRIAEWQAMIFLMCKGYRILGHRLRTQFGEVDLAAWKNGVLVIVEVKARATFDAGAYAVTPMAQQRIARAAQVLAGRWRLQGAPFASIWWWLVQVCCRDMNAPPGSMSAHATDLKCAETITRHTGAKCVCSLLFPFCSSLAPARVAASPRLSARRRALAFTPCKIAR